ncbi:hypothetical protein GCM10027430_23740 [Lysobacter tyrosinilyticus]
MGNGEIVSMRELRIVDAAELAVAYVRAGYALVMDEDALHLRVGEHARDVEAYWPVRRYGFITAWNPASIPYSDTANETANAMLVARLDAIGVQRLPAHAFASDGSWREAGWLIADMEESLLDLLGREFRQAGILSWNAGEPVRLRMLMPCPADAPDNEWIDWVGA